MTRHEKVGLEAIKAVLLPHGFQVEFEARSTHHAASIRSQDGRRFRLSLIGSGRAGDHEVATYARQNAQRFLRQQQRPAVETPEVVEPETLTFHVIKRTQRLFIVCTETGETVYTVPDFLRPYIRNRQALNALAAKLTGGPKDIRRIAAFESSLRPN